MQTVFKRICVETFGSLAHTLQAQENVHALLLKVALHGGDAELKAFLAKVDECWEDSPAEIFELVQNFKLSDLGGRAYVAPQLLLLLLPSLLLLLPLLLLLILRLMRYFTVPQLLLILLLLLLLLYSPNPSPSLSPGTVLQSRRRRPMASSRPSRAMRTACALPVGLWICWPRLPACCVAGCRRRRS